MGEAQSVRSLAIRLGSMMVLGAAVLTAPGCGWIGKIVGLGKDITTETTRVLDNAIDALGNASADWQKVLADAQQQLTKDVQATVRNEIGVIASRSIAQAGVELRCNADFIRDRVRQGLIRIKAEFLHQPVPPVEPGLCQVVPVAVDRESVPDHVKALEFYGYDFDQATELKVFHETTSGRQDVSSMLNRPTHYAMTLSFGGGGVQLTDRSQRFVLEWQGRPISTIAVIQPQTPVCQSWVTPFQPGSVTFVPPHTRGDRDFGGHGPQVTAIVTILVQPQEIRARVYMRAVETRSDWTTAEGSQEFSLYTPPPGRRIDNVSGNLSSSQSYLDSNHELDKFDLGSGGPVKRFVFLGDTDGDEAGTRTKVDIDFNRLTIEETQTGDCVSARAVHSLRATGLIRTDVLNRLSPQMLHVMEVLQPHR